jgi:phenylacetate-CoA ligase
MIILRGVNLFPTNIEELILQTAALSPHFQCVLSRPDRLDELTVRVERRADADPATGEIAGAVLCDRIKNTIGVAVAVHVVAPGEVERSTGKVQRVVDTRGA